MHCRLLAKPPAERAEPEVAKLATYMSSLPRFVEVPQAALLGLAREAMHEHHPPGNIVCKQGEQGITGAARQGGQESEGSHATGGSASCQRACEVMRHRNPLSGFVAEWEELLVGWQAGWTS